jgi:hypothetical protein
MEIDQKYSPLVRVEGPSRTPKPARLSKCLEKPLGVYLNQSPKISPRKNQFNGIKSKGMHPWQ